ncbi:MAG: DNA polymerase III subunit delta [Gammaproteobacteria bacterium]|nr:DNA polymerase III subunit delta [Gammaproteobacteria bacterium]
MNIKPEQLKAQLKRGLSRVYFLSGDEPLQLAECADVIRAAAREQGFIDRELLHVEPGFDWSVLYDAATAMSLFAQRRIIELRLKNYSLGDAGSAALTTYLQAPPEDNIFLVTAPKADGKSKKLAWYKQLETAADCVQVWPIEAKQLPGWISHRVKTKGMNITPGAARMLAERVEGNLLAASQDIEKLALLYPDQVWDEELVLEAVADSAKYDVFGLVESALLGDRHRYAHVLEHLRASGTEPILVVWALAEELRRMHDMALARAAGHSPDQVMRDGKVWGNRQGAARAAMDRFRPIQWVRMLRHAAQIDRMIKGQQPGNTWDEILKLGLAMAGCELLRA